MLRRISLSDIFTLHEDRFHDDPTKRRNDWRKCRVSEGAAGEVVRAWCEGSVRGKVAIKRLLSDGPALQRSFSSMAGAASGRGRLELTDEQRFFLSLQHENIVHCHGILHAGKAARTYAIVMELCVCDLNAYLRDESNWAAKTQQEIDMQKIRVLQDVSKGILFLHESSTAHLDLKAGNILLHDSGTWKLCDFGEAVLLHRGADATVDMEAAGDVRNLTAEIAAPELFDGRCVGVAADIFAFGCVMWSALTRLQAWHWLPGHNKAIAIQARVGLQNKRPRVPDNVEEWRNVIRMCLHANPAQRPSAKTVTEWAHRQVPRRTGRRRASRASTEAERVVEVPRLTLLRELEWSGTVKGLVSCAEAPIAPVHGCRFECECDGDTLRITTTASAIEGVPEEAVRALFDDTDEDHNGLLDKGEIKKLLQRGGVEWSEQLEDELSVEWRAMSAGRREIDFACFYRWWQRSSDGSDDAEHGGRIRREMHKVQMYGGSADVRFSCRVAAGFITSDERAGSGMSWSVGGRYVGKMDSANSNEWEEEALSGEEETDFRVVANLAAVLQPEPIRATFTQPDGQLGIIFGDRWPEVKKIKEPKAGQPPFLVQDFPEVRRGCKLLRIESQGSAEGGDAVVEGEAVLMSFQDAVPLITAGRSEEQPLVLTFAPPVDDDEGGPEPSPYQR